MTNVAVEPIQVSTARLAQWLRIVLIALAAVALVAVAFAVGRATTGHTSGSTTTVYQPASGPGPVCHPHGAC
ncbi:MAG: hypothetical protein QOC66_1633 [Pseudonocardiales bacterium]|jgi:ABC-type transporter Mla subunit MlaD|nr:hypothetical protein [Pseudonocardiales bacterium]